MSTQAAQGATDLDALEQNATALIDEQANSTGFLPAMGLKAMRVVKVVPILTAELRLLRAALAGLTFDAGTLGDRCPVCGDYAIVNGHEPGAEIKFHCENPGCPLAAYWTWHRAQGREGSNV